MTRLACRAVFLPGVLLLILGACERNVRRAAASPRGARGEATMRAVEDLERALPQGAELMIADMPAWRRRGYGTATAGAGWG